MGEKKVRDSNFELLRIIAIFGIILHHLVIKGADTCGYVDSYNYSRDGIIGLIINSMVVGGVNCFILITGWFGVNRLYKGFLKVFLETCLFGLISYFLVCVLSSEAFSIPHLLDSLDFRNNWFVVSYMMLLLVTPMIERSLLGIKYQDFRNWIFLLTVFNLVFVLLFNRMNNHGYNALQFIYLYYIARFLRCGLESKRKWVLWLKQYSVWIYMLSVILLFGGYLFFYGIYKAPQSIKWFGYNQPLVILLAISLFLSIERVNFKSKFVNTLATGVFGIFVLHTTTYMIPLRNDFSHSLYIDYGYGGLVLFGIMIFVLGTIISVPGAKIVTFLINRFIITNKK